MFGTVIKPAYSSQKTYNRKRPQVSSTWSQQPVPYSSHSVRRRRRSNCSSGDDSDHIENIRLGSPKASQVPQDEQNTHDEDDDEEEEDEEEYPPQSSSQAISISSTDGDGERERSSSRPHKRKRVASPTPSLPSIISISSESEYDEPDAPEEHSPEPEYRTEVVYDNVFSMKLRRRDKGDTKQASLQELRQARQRRASQCPSSQRVQANSREDTDVGEDSSHAPLRRLSRGHRPQRVSPEVVHEENISDFSDAGEVTTVCRKQARKTGRKVHTSLSDTESQYSTPENQSGDDEAVQSVVKTSSAQRLRLPHKHNSASDQSFEAEEHGQDEHMSDFGSITTTEDLVEEVDERVIMGTRLRSQDHKPSQAELRLSRYLRRRRHTKEPVRESDSDDEGANPDAGNSDARTASEDGSRSTPSNEEDSRSESATSVDNFIDDEEQDMGEEQACLINVTHRLFDVEPFRTMFACLVGVANRAYVARGEFMESKLAEDSELSETITTLRHDVRFIRDTVVSSGYHRALLEKLETFPVLKLKGREEGCQVCLSDWESASAVQLSGEPYKAEEGFMLVEDDGRSRKRRSATSTSTRSTKWSKFTICASCEDRVMSFHAFSHWEYNLFCSIVERIHWLESTFGDDTLDKSTLPTSTDDDEEIVEWLQSTSEGTFDEQWKVFTDMLRSAKDLTDRRSYGNEAVRDGDD